MSNYLNFHPSTVAEARAFAESLPGGTKTLTLPQRQDSLLLPMPSKPQLQLQPALQPVLMPMPMPMPTPMPMPMPMPRPQPQSQQSNTSMITDSLATGSPAAGFPITGSTTAAETTVVKTTDATTETAVGYRNNETSPRTPSCGVIPSLQNVVASANVGCRLDLKMIALHARNSEYNPRRMSAVIMRIREPKATGLIFASGKMVVTGAKSENDSRLASRKFARVLQKLGYNAAITEYKLCNLVATCDFQFGVDLARLKAFNPEFGCWEPEQFPGLIYKLVRPKVTLIVFGTGKVVLTGAKEREQIYQVIDMLHPVLSSKSYRGNSAGGLNVVLILLDFRKTWLPVKAKSGQ